jgi:hypothetical protein
MRLRILGWLIAIMVVANIAFFLWPRPPQAVPAAASLPAVKRLQLVEEDAVAEPAGAFKQELEAESEALLQAAPDALSLAEPEPILGPYTDPDPGPEPTPEPEPEPSCWRLGPLGEAAYREVRAVLNVSGIDWQVNTELVGQQPKYRVYLPTSDVPAEVRRISQELKSKGIDNFRITEGELAGSLSLGLFVSQELAQRLVNAAQAAGHSALILQIERGHLQYWFALTGKDLARLGWVAIDGEVDGFTSLNMRQQNCP